MEGEDPVESEGVYEIMTYGDGLQKILLSNGGSTKNNGMACAGVGSLTRENAEILDPLRGVYEKFSLEEGRGSGKIFRLLHKFDPVPPPLPIINDWSLKIQYPFLRQYIIGLFLCCIVSVSE